MTTTNKVTFGEQLRTLENGIKANFTDVASVIVGGVTYTIAELTAKIDAFLAAQAATVAAQSAYHQAVTAEKVSDAAARVFRSQVQAYAVSRYGKTNPILTQLSFTPAKAKKTTAAIKAVAVLKVKATRAARHTMNKKQKKDIKGSVDPSIAQALASETVSASEPAGQGTQGTQSPEVIAPVATSAPVMSGTSGVPSAGPVSPGGGRVA
jgi:uncharacterized protein YyaL (SSP411 family)